MSTTISSKSFVKSQKASGAIEVEDLSASLSQAMQNAGVSEADLKKIAGKDGVINKGGELKKLYKLLDRFDSSPGDKKLQLDGAMGDLHAALKAEGAGNRAQDDFAKQLGKKHGVLDVNNLGAELTQELQGAGLSVKHLQAIAGADGQIKGAAELKKLYGVLDAFDSKPGDKTLQGDTLRGAVEAEVESNRGLAQYKTPGAKNAGKMPQLTTDDAVVVPQRDRLDEVQLDAKTRKQPDATACRKTAEKITTDFLKKNFDPAPPLVDRHAGQNIQVAYAENKNGQVKVDSTQAKIARDYIDQALDAGMPVMVGVSDRYYKKNKGNADQLTEHWVSIVGRGYDDEGRVFYTFNDPANGKTGRFYVDQDTGKLFKVKETGNGEWATNYFEMTQVRTYRDPLPERPRPFIDL